MKQTRFFREEKKVSPRFLFLAGLADRRSGEVREAEGPRDNQEEGGGRDRVPLPPCHQHLYFIFFNQSENVTLSQMSKSTIEEFDWLEQRSKDLD